MATRETITSWFKELQDSICEALETADGTGQFREDAWERPGGGGGRSRVLQSGAVIEKGGVNFSAVHGEMPERIREALSMTGTSFYATGVSIVLHPQNPWVPIIHMNTRYFEMDDGTHWFGGGIDLTPHYIVPEQAAWFHEQVKAVCDTYHTDLYPEYKEWADRYFYIEHRQETRGIGGIFFDRLQEVPWGDKQAIFSFVQDVGRAFAPTYVQLMQENRYKPYSEREKQWQLLRRGRYVEFNLVYDKGTKFGLQTAGRIESILMSLPQHASWEYDYQPEEGSPEAQTLAQLKKGVDWLGQ